MGQDFFRPEDRRHHGTVCHRVLSTITTVDDITAAIQQHVQAGEISAAEAAEIETTLREQLAEPEKLRWFKAGNRVLNERDILHPRQGTYRPDRVMFAPDETVVVDFKFGRPREEYRRQVAGYMEQIRLMEPGKRVKGYLWYIADNRLEEVTA